MSDQDRFIGFKEKLIRDNEEKYGKEARERWGDAAVDSSNAKLMNLTEEEYAEVDRLSREIIDSLAAALGKEDPAGPAGLKIAELHRKWLSFFWPTYSKEAHAGLGRCMWPMSASLLTMMIMLGRGQLSFSGTPSQPMPRNNGGFPFLGAGSVVGWLLFRTLLPSLMRKIEGEQR